MPRPTLPHPEALQARLVELVRVGRPPDKVAADPEPSPQATHNWVRRAALNEGHVATLAVVDFVDAFSHLPGDLQPRPTS